MRLPSGVCGLVALALLAACDDDSNVAVQDPQANVSVSGEVTNIQNDIAVDGGIVLDIAVAKDGQDRLVFGGLFTVPPPTNDDLKLYDVVRRVEVGDMVRGWGVRRESGIILEKLWILDGQP
jgi:hypothetical protein